MYLCREDASGRLVVLKIFQESVQRSMKDAFFREVKNLTELTALSFIPKILFAYEQKTSPVSFILGTEYRPGKTLLELKGSITQEELNCLGRMIYLDIQNLHEKGYTHGDLSPRNILAQACIDNGNSSWELTFVDWEFAEKIQDQGLSTYEQFRGTPGFSGTFTAEDRCAQDWNGFESCMKYLGIDFHWNGQANDQMSGKKKRKWWPL